MRTGRDSDVKRNQGVSPPRPPGSQGQAATIEYVQLIQEEGVFAKRNEC